VLGRVIDLNILITKHVNGKFYKDVEYCLKKFEASELSHIIDFHRAAGIVQETHSVLSEHLDLDSFQTIMTEMDEAVGPTAFAGRTMMHVLASLVTDILPNYSYNGFTRRFVRSPALLKVTDRPKNPKADHQHFAYGAHPARAFEMANKLHRSFIGSSHIKALVRILGTSGLPLLINNLLTNLKERLEISKAYLDAIAQGLPPCKLPKAMYGLAGCYGVFDALLKPILAYVDLKPEVFQAFKEIGNALCFIQSASDVLDWSELQLSLHGVFVNREKIPLSNIAQPRFQNAINSFHHAIPELAGMTSALHDTRINQEWKPLSSGAIQHLSRIIEPFRSSWTEQQPSSKALDLESSGSFCRLWSALTFLFGIQSSQYGENSSKVSEVTNTHAENFRAAISDDSQFGHGFFWSGAVLIHLMKQRALYQALDFSRHVLRVEAYERASAARIQGVGLADPTLRDEARNFVRLKIKHVQIYSIAFAATRPTFSETEARHDFIPPDNYAPMTE
jgi:cytoplasmic FMR1 interacting protein